MEPAFAHHGADELPVIDAAGVKGKLVLGTFMGQRSPVVTSSETLLVDLELPAGGSFTIPAEHRERAIQVVTGALIVGGVKIAAPKLLVLEEGSEGYDPSRRTGALRGAWRRSARWTAASLVELRLVVQGTDRKSQGRLERRPLPDHRG